MSSRTTLLIAMLALATLTPSVAAQGEPPLPPEDPEGLVPYLTEEVPQYVVDTVTGLPAPESLLESVLTEVWSTTDTVNGTIDELPDAAEIIAGLLADLWSTTDFVNETIEDLPIPLEIIDALLTEVWNTTDTLNGTIENLPTLEEILAALLGELWNTTDTLNETIETLPTPSEIVAMILMELWSTTDTLNETIADTTSGLANIIVQPQLLATTNDGPVVAYFAALAAAPTDDVTITATGSSLGINDEFDGSGDASLTFTQANWFRPQPMFVDATGTTPGAYQITHATASSDDRYNEFQGLTVDVVVLNAPDVEDIAPLLQASVHVLPNVLTINETAEEPGQFDSAQYFVALGSAPSGDVTVEASFPSADLTVAGSSGASHTFTSGNWFMPAAFTVTAVPDQLDEGDSEAHRIFNIVTSTDEYYQGYDASSVLATIIDDDVAGFLVTESDDSTEMTEASGTDTDSLDVVLASQPAGDVVLDLDLDGTSQYTADAATLTFTAANWDTPQTVTLTAVNDAVDDGDSALTLGIAVNATNSSDDYDSVVTVSIDVAVIDDDTAGVTNVGGDTLDVTEGGATDSFTLVLDSEPTGTVTITVGSSDLGEATVSPTILTFTSADWDTPQEVTVTPVADGVVDADQIIDITLGFSSDGADDGYGSFSLADLTATVNNVDTGTFTYSGFPLTITESTSGQLNVVLNDEPEGTVTLSVVSENLDEATVTPAALTFDGTDWNVSKPITISGVQDKIDDGNYVVGIRVTVDQANSVPGFAGNLLGPVTIVDIDTAGITVDSGSGLSVDEDATTDSFTVVLNSKPATGTVAIDVASSDAGEATVSPTTLTFTDANWDTPQTVTVTGVADNLVDGDQDIDVTLAVDTAISSDEYDSVTTSPLSVSVVDVDVLVLSLAGGDRSVDEGAGTLTFTVTSNVPSLEDVDFTYTTTNATAEGGEDFVEVTAQASSLPGDGTTTTVEFTIDITDDLLDEDVESFTVSITGANVGAVDSVVITLRDNDALPSISFAVDTPASGPEGADGEITLVDLNVSLSQPSGRDVTVTIAVTGGTADSADFFLDEDNILEGNPLLVTGVTVTIPAGEVNATVQFSVRGDDINEVDETANFGLRNPINAVLGTASSLAYVIENDDVPTVQFAVAASSDSESRNLVTIQVTLSQSTVETVTVNVALNGTSTADGSDASISSAVVTFAPGQTSKVVTLQVVDDADVEADETVVLDLETPTNALLGTLVQHTYTIVDND